MVDERDEPSNVSKILTIHDVAQYLRLSEATVYQMARDGLIPGLRLGRTWRFRQEMIDDWLNHAETKARAELD